MKRLSMHKCCVALCEGIDGRESVKRNSKRVTATKYLNNEKITATRNSSRQ